MSKFKRELREHENGGKAQVHDILLFLMRWRGGIRNENCERRCRVKAAFNLLTGFYSFWRFIDLKVGVWRNES